MAEHIAPIIGENIRMVRNGRTLLDIDRVELGRPGVTAILGHNGAGKSLLLKVLAGLVIPDAGTVTWNGREPKTRDYSRLGFMKQNAVLLRRSSLANLEYVLRLAGAPKQDAREKAHDALGRAGLAEIANTSARLLSGGERQRLSLARTLVTAPEVLVLDEPTASLDPASTRAIENEIMARKEKGLPIILVTHSLRQARYLADDIVFLDQARILAQQSAKTFFMEPGSKEAALFLGDQ
jgi:tungstate transport system ATP-binding protein